MTWLLECINSSAMTATDKAGLRANNFEQLLSLTPRVRAVTKYQLSHQHNEQIREEAESKGHRALINLCAKHQQESNNLTSLSSYILLLCSRELFM